MSPAETVAGEPGRARTAPGPLAFWALALALLALAPLARASVPRAAATDGAALLVASLAEPSRLAPLAASDDVERFALFAGDELARELAPLALASRVREESFALRLGAAVFGLEPLRGPPPLSEDLCQGAPQRGFGMTIRPAASVVALTGNPPALQPGSIPTPSVRLSAPARPFA